MDRVGTFIAVAFCLLWHAAALSGLLDSRFPRLSRSERRMIGLTALGVAAAFAVISR